MNGIKIIHTADLHLGSARTGVNGGKAEIKNTFMKIIRLCKTDAIDFLLIAGDLFDSPFVNNKDAEEIISSMEQIPDTTIAIAPGNHDPACPGSVYLKYQFPENVVIFSSFAESIDFPEKGVRLCGAGFTDRFENLPLLQGFNDAQTDLISLCVLHGDFVSDGASSTYNPITPSQIENCGFDYLALGHIHKRSDVQKLGKTSFAYCGCPDGMGFDETGSHGIYIGTVEKNCCAMEYKEMSSRQYIEDIVDISSCDNSFNVAETVLKHITKNYGSDFNKNLYRISLTGALPADTVIDAVQVQTILSEDLSYIHITDNTETDISDLSKIAGETSLRGIFVKKMLDKINDAPENAETYKNALKFGLKAFSKGVKLNDN